MARQSPSGLFSTDFGRIRGYTATFSWGQLFDFVGYL